jgi:hypothetical protein
VVGQMAAEEEEPGRQFYSSRCPCPRAATLSQSVLVVMVGRPPPLRLGAQEVPHCSRVTVRLEVVAAAVGRLGQSMALQVAAAVVVVHQTLLEVLAR